MTKKPRPKLCAAGRTLLREINTLWPDRDKKSDGWLASPAHSAANPNSDHEPDPVTGIVRALDVDADLDNGDPDDMADLMEQLRLLAARRQDRGRIAYLIHNRQIASPKRDKFGRAWRWRPHDGRNPHRTHGHISFTRRGDLDGAPFGVTG